MLGIEHSCEANFTPQYIQEIADALRAQDEQERKFYKVLLVVDSCVAVATLVLIAMLIFF